MAADISGLTYFLPILGFLLVFVVAYAILAKTKVLGENAFIDVFVAFLLAIIFATVSSARDYVAAVTPWFAVLMVAIFFILVIVGFSGVKIEDFIGKKMVWLFVIFLLGIFLVAAIYVFNFNFSIYIPSSLLENRIFGAVLLLIVAALTAWVLTRKEK